MKQLNIYALATATCMTFSSYTFAGGYIGAGVGQSSIDICDDFGGLKCDDTDTGYRIFGGFEINDTFAIEGGFSDLGEAVVSGNGVTVTAETTAFTITGKGSIPVNEHFSAFGRLGIAFWDAEFSATGFASDSDTGTDLTFGAGGEFSLNNQFSVRAEWERVDFDGDGVDLFSIGGVFKF